MKLNSRSISVLLWAAVALSGLLAALALASGHRVASDGDPYRVTPQRLRSELAATGLDIRYVHPAGETEPTVAGIARFGLTEPVAFEYQLFPSSDEATIRDVGELRAEDFGWREKYPFRIFENEVQGVLGNVALAEYELTGGGRGHYTTEIAHRSQLAAQRIARALDDVIFRSFPPNDPYAHAMSSSP